MFKIFLTRQFFNFLVVGGLAATLHWLSRILFSSWLTFSWSVVAAFAVGITTAFTLNCIFVFRNSVKPVHKQARDFFMVNLLFFPVIWGISISLNHAFLSIGMTYHTEALAHGIAIITPTFATFLIYKFFTFKDSQYGQP
jgi:putative flippase GtrA